MKVHVKSKRILLIFLFAALIAIFARQYLLSNIPVHIGIEMHSAESGQMQLYFYSGNDLTPIDEAHSMIISYQGSEKIQICSFRLPLVRLQNTRLDIDGPSKILISDITLSYLGKQSKASFDKIAGYDDCNLVSTSQGILFERTGDDPKINFQDLRFINHRIRYLSILAAVVAVGLLQLVLLIAKKRNLMEKYYRYRFLFEELVKRDFKKKYKRTVLGMLWSMLNPLLMLLVMWVIFSRFFGQTTNHYVIYLFAGNIVFAFFNEASGVGMNSLISNASIFTKVNIPKYMFLLSQSITALINFGLTLIIFFLFVIGEGLPITLDYVCLLFPIICLVVFNIGLGMILSALFVFFRDIEYLWSVFSTLLMYLSAIFYDINGYTETIQYAFLLNPVYVYIRYFRKIVLEGIVPSPWFHLLALGYALVAVGIGCYVYKRNNTKFLYYV